MSDNLSELLGRKGLTDNLFDALGRVAKPQGTPSDEELSALADEFLIGTANTFGTASFYDFLKPENKGKKVYVCNGTACLCAGRQEDVRQTLEGHFTANEIGHMTCLGRCHENGAFHFKGKNYSGKAIDQLDDIITEKEPLNNDEYIVKSNGEPILTAPYTDLSNYYEPFKKALQKNSGEILEEIKRSNVRGRGGAGFPMGLS